MVLLIYADMLSQPSRAVITLCKEAAIVHEIKLVTIAKGETRSKPFRLLNPLGKVPFIDDDGFRVGESHAILRYLCNTRNLPNHWYPKEPKARALVDQYLDWHHLNIRYGAAKQLFAKVIAPRFQLTVDPALVKEARDVQIVAFKQLESWLKQSDFLAGPQISIADLSAAEEIYNFLLVESEFLVSFPFIAAWLKRVKASLSRSWNEVHAPFYKWLAKSNPDALKLRLDRAHPDLEPAKPAIFHETSAELFSFLDNDNHNKQMSTHFTSSSLPTSSLGRGEWSPVGNKMVAGKVLSAMKSALATDGKAAVDKLKGVFRFVVTNEKETTTWTVNLMEGNGWIRETTEGKPDAIFILSDDAFIQLATGQLTPQSAFLSRKLRLSGNLGKAMGFQKEVFEKQKYRVQTTLNALGLLKPKASL